MNTATPRNEFHARARRLYAMLAGPWKGETTISRAADFLGYYPVTEGWRKVVAESNGHLVLDGETIRLAAAWR